MSQVAVFETVKAMREAVAAWHAAGEKVALVPTMGALHEGHIALVTEAQKHARRVIVSIFVNPTQFAPHEDFKKYPRTFDSDRAQLEAADADAIYFPAVEEMYPPGFASRVLLLGPAAVGLEDRFRPTHFEGGSNGLLQAVHTEQGRFRHLRREGLSAAQGGDAHGPRPRSRHRDRAVGHLPRGRRPRNVLTQPLPLRRGARFGADAAQGDAGPRRPHPQRRPAVPGGRGRAKRDHHRRLRARLSRGPPCRHAGAR